MSIENGNQDKRKGDFRRILKDQFVYFNSLDLNYINHRWTYHLIITHWSTFNQNEIKNLLDNKKLDKSPNRSNLKYLTKGVSNLVNIEMHEKNFGKIELD